MYILATANSAADDNIEDFHKLFKFMKRHKWKNEPKLPEGDWMVTMNRMVGEDTKEGLIIVIVAKNNKYDMDDAVSLISFLDDFPEWNNEPTHILAVENPSPI